MARPKAADYDATRDRILLRAVQAFAESGYPSASMSSLAARCDTSKAALYHYFESKEAILFESLDRYTSRLLSTVTRAGADARPGGASAVGRLCAALRALLVEYRDSRAYHVALLNDIRFLSPPQREQIQRQERAVVDAFAEIIRQAAPGRFDEARARPATMAILGMINFTFAWLRPDGRMSYEQYAELVCDIVVNGLAPAPDRAARASA